MQDINYRQDFTLWQRFYYKDENGDLKDFGFPPYDFKIFYWTSSRANSYVVSCRYKDGKRMCSNCRDKDDRLIVVFDNHKLMPGELHGELVMDVPSDLYPDGYRRDPMPLHTDIRLVGGPTSAPSRSESIAILPYIKGQDGKDGKDGKDFTYEDMTEEQIEDFAERVSEKVINEGVDGKIEEAIQKKIDEDLKLDEIPEETFQAMFNE